MSGSRNMQTVKSTPTTPSRTQMVTRARRDTQAAVYKNIKEGKRTPRTYVYVDSIADGLLARHAV